MRFNKVLDVTALVLVAVCGQVARGITVNGDIEGDLPDTTYSGDNGVLSSPTGTTWNSIVHFVNAGSLLDEFGNVTGVGVTWQVVDNGSGPDAAATNALQDSGTNGEGFDITGLSARPPLSVGRCGWLNRSKPSFVLRLSGSFGTSGTVFLSTLNVKSTAINS